MMLHKDTVTIIAASPWARLDIDELESVLMPHLTSRACPFTVSWQILWSEQICGQEYLMKFMRALQKHVDCGLVWKQRRPIHT